MSFYVHRTMHPAIESIFLLNQFANNHSPDTFKIKFHQTYGIPLETLSALFDDIASIYQSITSNLTACETTIQSLFETLDPDASDTNFIGSAFIPIALDGNLQEHFLNFNVLDTPSKKRYVLDLFSLLPHEIDFTLNSSYDVFQCVEEFIHSIPLRYGFMKIFYEFEDFYTQMITLLDQVTLLMAPYQEIFDKLFHTYLSDVFDTIEQEGAVGLKKYIPFDLSDEEDYHIYPYFFNSNSATLTRSYSGINHIFIGFSFIPISACVKTYSCDETQLLSFLKCISDKSKLEILKLLRHNKLYATELADKLGITSATISHHMNALAKLNLISVEKDNNKIYYLLNTDTVGSYLMKLNNLLDL